MDLAPTATRAYPLPSGASQAANIRDMQLLFRKHAMKEDFLESLQGNGRYKYRRYQGGPLRYAGGKTLAVGHIIEHLPDCVDAVVSPFIGGGAVEIACARELGIRVQAYDVFDILTNYWQVQLNAPVALAERISQWPPTQEVYRAVKARLKREWTKEEPFTDPMELAAHYWFNHNLSYGPGFLGWMSRIYEEPGRFRSLLRKVRDFDCPTLSVEQGDFRETIPRHRDDFLYCDPPYYLDGDSRMFRGIYPQRNFPVHHKGFDHAVLRDLLRQHHGGFILSYNDCQTIREWYSDFTIIEVEWQYTLGQGETRIGKNRIEAGMDHVKASHELLILGGTTMPRKRAMTPADASRRKVRGHKNERAFAELIGGEVSKALQTDKRDVLDRNHRFHSVKSGTWWQIFLYARSRFETNTVFQGLGTLAELMIACLDAFPESYADYRVDRESAKLRLQTPMRSLREELGKPGILPAFFEKSLFNAGEVQYLTILPACLADAPDNEKEFHIFDRVDVVQALCASLEITNSVARNASQTDAQKVLFRISGRNCGEIEVRSDSPVHHRQAKFRLNGIMMLQLLVDSIGNANRLSKQLVTYGRATRTFRP